MTAPSLVDRVRVLLRPTSHRSSGPGDERFARAALGYSTYSPRQIVVTPRSAAAPLNTRAPHLLTELGRADELLFDAVQDTVP